MASSGNSSNEDTPAANVESTNSSILQALDGLRKRVEELERKIAETDGQSVTESIQESTQESSQNEDSNNWKSRVAFERRQLDKTGTFKTEPAKDIGDVLGGRFRLSAKTSIRILLDNEDETVDLYIEKTPKDSSLFNTFMEIDELQRYQNVKIGTASIRFRAPYAPLYHNKELFEKKAKELPPLDKSREQLEDLLKLCEYDWIKKHHDGKPEDTVKFSELWKLYPPNSMVVVTSLREHKVLRRIVSTQSPEEEDSDQKFEVVCTEVSHDGRSLGEREVHVMQDNFSGSKKLVELEACPWDSYKEDEKKRLEDELRDRWDIWYKIYHEPAVKAMIYRGNCVSVTKIVQYFTTTDSRQKFDSSGMNPGTIFEGETFMSKISGRVIIDPEALTKAHPILSALFSLVKGGQKMVWETADKKRSPAVIPAFSLDEDQWVIVAVKGLENPKWLDNWQSLKYSKNDKPKFDRLKTLVQGHKAFLDKQNPDSGKTGDFIPEKGNALVILLSGPSGLGKTLTAECLENATEKPLYRINLGRFSGTPGNPNTNMEAQIERIFANASAWGAILLIDEAEAIMVERTPDNINLNSWISVFLRKIEYYQGIIVLTTNLLHLMDFAFQSRIKFAIRFDRMSDSIRGAIWEDILENLPDSGGESRRLLDKAKNSWSLKTKYNGRHIRNVVWNARILAAPSEGKKKLTLSEAIEEVIDDTDNFIEQIDDAKKEEEQRLLGEGWGPG